METNVRTNSSVVFVIVLTVCLGGPPAGSLEGGEPESPALGRRLLQDVLKAGLVDEIVFAVRVSGRDHWYVNFGYYCNNPGRKGYGAGGRLCRLNLRTGEVKVLLDDPQGGVRDPQVHYDGKKILFSYRKGGETAFHLYEIRIDGGGLVQLTDGDDNDVEPTYLPGGGILFVSSRCRRFVPCWCTPVATLYRCDADGRNVRMVSSNVEQDNTPWVLSDGRVLYMRWEYVDRSQTMFHHLWTVNPDGTGQMVFFGNQNAGVTMLDAKPIPGTSKVVASFSPGHGRPEHMGAITVVDPNAGPDVLPYARRVSKGKSLFRDPYPLSEDFFLVAGREGILLMDRDGNTELVYRLAKSDAGLECHEPRPLGPRVRERIIPPRTDPAQPTGRLVLSDIYEGRNMAGIERGQIKKLLVLEQLPKPVNFNGLMPYHISWMEPLDIGGTFTLSRVLGVVPVQPDGSAYVELPALRSLQFVALDGQGLSVKRMQSFVTLQPGETTGCAGCHEQRSHTPTFHSSLLALGRPVSRIESFPDIPDVLDYPRDIQPILDKHCVACHRADRWEGKVDLTGDRTPLYSLSYWTVVKRRLIADGRNEPYGNRAPRSIGSSASRLMKLIDGRHYGAKASQREHTLIRLWIETGATYTGTYAALGSGMYPVRFPVEVIKRRCGECHGGNPKLKPTWQGYDIRPWETLPFSFGRDEPPLSLCNLTRPDKSVLLRAPLSRKAGGLGLCKADVFADTNDADYQKMLAAVAGAAKQLNDKKRFDMPGFRPDEPYTREMQRSGILPANLGPDDPIDVYATDQAYWKSFWLPAPKSAPTR